jgi:hypothetical protein
MGSSPSSDDSAGTISGTVECGPVPCIPVNVIVVGTSQGAICDDRGRYTLTHVRPGRVTVCFLQVEDSRRTIVVDVRRGGVVQAPLVDLSGPFTDQAAGPDTLSLAATLHGDPHTAGMACPVHGRERLFEAVVPVVYGLRVEQFGYGEAMARTFPYGASTYSGGCMPGSAQYARVLRCQGCLRAEADFLKHGSLKFWT